MLASGTAVSLLPVYRDALAFPPPDDVPLYIAVHPGALRAGERNRLTQVVAAGARGITWVGALDERMLEPGDAPPMRDARALLSWYLGRGSTWNVIWPGDLSRRPGEDLFTVYRTSRPWVILGELDDGSPLAAPLNDATNPTWFTPVIEANDILLPNAKRCQLELAHLWSFPPGLQVSGSISRGTRRAVNEALRGYFGTV